MKVVYASPLDEVDSLPGHPWPIGKYRRVLERLLAEGALRESDVDRAGPADDEDILRVHSLDYVERAHALTLTAEEVQRLELPLTSAIVAVASAFVDGTIRASCHAVRDGACVHLGGGLHHAFPAYGTGFCMFNDIAVSIRHLLDKGMVERALVVDCDLHQGDGTAYIFRHDPRVVTFSIHQEDNFPYTKQRSTLDIGLPRGTGDDVYLARLQDGLRTVLTRSGEFGILHYQAGADPFHDDTLGGLALSLEGLRERDRLVVDAAMAHRVPIVATFGGGYARSTDDVVAIHAATVCEVRRAAARA
jgi:acetoin utilization deacetylase AcuC-like enzyme